MDNKDQIIPKVREATRTDEQILFISRDYNKVLTSELFKLLGSVWAQEQTLWDCFKSTTYKKIDNTVKNATVLHANCKRALSQFTHNRYFTDLTVFTTAGLKQILARVYSFNLPQLH